MMALRTSPFDVFDEILAPLAGRPQPRQGAAPLRYMSRRDDDAVTVRVELPGVRAEDLELSCVADSDGTVIDLTARRDVFGAIEELTWSGRLRGVDPSSVGAELTDGVLLLRGELSQPSARRIEVTTGRRSDVLEASGSDSSARDGEESASSDS